MKRVPLALVLLASGIAVALYPLWPGSAAPYIAFHLGFVVMCALAFTGPVSYAYGFLSAFLFLGFWGKLMNQMSRQIKFIEPIGQFDDSAASWDTAIWVATVAALAVAAARAVQIYLWKKRGAPTVQEQFPAPAFYVRYRTPLWAAALFVMLTLNVWNYFASFYQIGVNPQLILPARLNVIFAWLINWGFAFLIACLAYWETRTRTGTSVAPLILVLTEAASSGISALSRSAYLLHGFAGCLAWLEVELRRSTRKKILNVLLIGVLFVAGLAASMWLVQKLRIDKYFGTEVVQSPPVDAAQAVPSAPVAPLAASATSPAAIPVKAQQTSLIVREMMDQLPYLIVNRWVGLEAVLAVTGYPDKGTGLLMSAVREDPKGGINTLYQRIAKSEYKESSRFTFLTLAGAPAVLFYSGSLAVVAAGMFLIAGMLLLIDHFARKWTGNPFVVSLAAVAMAYTVTQLTFPYLALIFFVELLATIVAIAFVQQWATRKST